MKIKPMVWAGVVSVFGWFGVSNSSAWDYEGHYTINQLALATLPTNFPAFVLTPAARGRIGFLAGEPDRWRNTSELALAHVNGPDHYLDLEQLEDYGLTPGTLPPLRYDFTVKLGLARAAHPEKFEPIDPDKDRDHTRELVGFLPWAITEYYAKLKSEFSYLKTFQAYGGTPEEIANAEANIIYTMGVMGHFVGDGSQPLHTSKHHNGWVGENPHGYPTNRTFHAWIDGGYFRKIGGLKPEVLSRRMQPAQHVGNPELPDGFFQVAVAYVVAQNKLVEPLYKLEKERKLSPRGDEINPEGRAFMEGQIVRGAQMLGDIWLSAWQDATEDKHLKTELTKRLKTGKAKP
jgi:hypothetical protein